jgi:hypothetical protein
MASELLLLLVKDVSLEEISTANATVDSFPV